MGILDDVKDYLSQRRGKTTGETDAPEAGVEDIIHRFESQYRDVREAVTAAVADTKRMELQLQGLEEQAKTWRARAEQAVEDDDEALARVCLGKELALRKMCSAKRHDLEEHRRRTDPLREALDELRSHLDEMKRQRNLLTARRKAAEARKKVGEASYASEDGELEAHFEQMTTQVERLEAEADAAISLQVGASPDPELEAKFAELEDSDEVGAALEKLKAKTETGG